MASLYARTRATWLRIRGDGDGTGAVYPRAWMGTQITSVGGNATVQDRQHI